MKTRIRLSIGIGLAGCAAVLIMALHTDMLTTVTMEQKGKPGSATPTDRHPLPRAANSISQPLHADEKPLLPPPVPALESTGLVVHTETVSPPPRSVARPAEESMLISWAARDPEGAGRWLNQNRNHPKFADMVRGYAIQIATTDPAAARQWAAVLNGNGNRFALGGTLEQHIDATEAMLKSPAAPLSGKAREVAAGLGRQADYTPVLVRQNPDEPPVLEMRPTNPFV